LVAQSQFLQQQIAAGFQFGHDQMIDVPLPATGGREIILSRYTQPEKERPRLLNQLKLQWPEQPPPKITAAGALAN
jgi:hypothetical protein